MADEMRKADRLARWRERRRLERVRTGDSPQKQAERRKGGSRPTAGADTQAAVDAIDEYARHTWALTG
jgi:hypothetical protein